MIYYRLKNFKDGIMVIKINGKSYELITKEEIMKEVADEIAKINTEKIKTDAANQAVDMAWHLQPRNIMDVLGVTDVRQAFLKLKEMGNTGNYSKLRLGDYITVTGMENSITTTTNCCYKDVTFEIVAFDHYLHRGKDEINSHHITFMSQNLVEIRQMHSTNNNQYYYDRTLATYLNTTVCQALTQQIGCSPLSVNLQWDYHTTHTSPLSVYVPQVEEVMSPGAGWGTLNYRGRQWWGDQSQWGQYGSPTLSSQFPLFALAPYKMQKKFNGQRKPWWTSTPHRDGTSAFSVIPVDGVDASGHGGAFDADADLSHGVALTFNL